ncbi:carbohydrate ABC transporter permease [Deinococcus roseus]|uniref:ABC transporter permease n=1 Tax=Deinococcus roseus TaxID=392414 RepID=A0ABQ2DCS5_9DEIO|nr:sugar ABC transporter permease [Deinococcus roseus]GGJ53632.1 ABC transporter permease [Deinococcus roseus]
MLNVTQNPPQKTPRKSSWAAFPFMAPATVMLIALTFFPIAYGIWMAFYNISLATLTSYEFVGLKNFREFIDTGSDFYRIVVRTIGWTFINVLLHVLVGIGLALLLQRPGLKFRKLFKALLILPWAVPSYITVLAWKNLIFNYDFGYFNTFLKVLHIAPVSWLQDPSAAYWATVIVNVWLGVPYMMMVASGALQSIPREMYESAEIDGASTLQQITRISIPMMWPMMAPSVILGLIWTFNNFNAVYLLTGGGPYGSTDLVVTYLYRIAFGAGSTSNFDYSLAAAFSVVVFLMLLLLVLFYMRVTKEQVPE